uniref:Interleukin-1 beta n=1 Tax=Poecilia latipinna TaxID=48699 RepID=A0A3B3UTF5_9TELE
MSQGLREGGWKYVSHLHGQSLDQGQGLVKYKNKTGKRMFIRRGDKLMEINGVDLQDLEPEELANMISEGNPLLVCQLSEQEEQLPLDEDTLQPYDKESTVLSFSWELKREEDTEEGEKNEPTDIEGNVCEDMCKENGESRDLLVIHMTNTSIAVVGSRGCEEFEGTGCTVDDIVLVADSSVVTCVSRGDVNFRQEKLADVLIKHVPTHRYLRTICSEKTVYSSPNPEKITIYYYKSNAMDKTFRGIAVVLNLTGSNCFLKCCKEGDRVLLQVETCEKQRLRQISKNDDCTFSFVFYMLADRTKQRKFESALHRGWFIHIANTDLVEMAETDGEMGDSSFLFIIQK